jgi:Succinylglutamate desuccinylase / Aspartoacylase family
VEPPARLTRRRLLRLAGVLPLGALLAACGHNPPASKPVEAAVSTSTPIPEPTVTPTPEPPFIVAEGEQQHLLMEGTPQETPLHVFGSGKEGSILAILGGVHGNEPGGWLAAEQIRDSLRPTVGALLVVPRANLLATQLFVRTTDELGDLNRLYPGSKDGLPMAQMAYEIVTMLRQYHVSHLIDMHESWAFFSDRTETQTGTAFLGQTISSRGQPGEALAKTLAETMNTRLQVPQEEFYFRQWPPRGFTLSTPTNDDAASPTAEPGTTGPNAVYGGSRSSLGLPTYIPGLAAILVEMGQQQALERRVAMHVEIVQETMRQIGISSQT